eukprot:gene17516-24266_t
MLSNLHFPNGSMIIPAGAFVYISTDDPKGLCDNCHSDKGELCSNLKPPRPEGCQDDPSWDAFIKAGWTLRFLHNYVDSGSVDNINPNLYGVLESIVCSRAEVFAGTYMSTFTGYIHRLRGYHGLGEATYYHSNHHTLELQSPNPHRPYGWWREWRGGWTDDEGQLI